ncbi:hypothetical protein [Achromobacter ruhlandii]|uniref:hypothetical protein n=1 Tax=Achromobacter ruhlandii TaxID=72557 RepID=UPI003BA182D3
MSQSLKINVIAVLVRRDAQTTTQTTVALHEAGLLRSIYGKENVTGAEVVAQREIDPDIEQNRLVASPIDSLVVPDIRQSSAVPKAFFHYGTGQYICVIGSILYVYSVSRTAKIAAWSRYYIPFRVDAFAELNGELYFRNGDDIYRFTADAHDDAGAPFEVLLQLPYMDLKAPGQMKRILGADIVMEGECTFSVAFDVRDPDAYTPPVRVRGNTRPDGVIPVECSGTEFSLIFRNLSSKPFRLDAVTLYFESLGAV